MVCLGLLKGEKMRQVQFIWRQDNVSKQKMIRYSSFLKLKTEAGICWFSADVHPWDKENVSGLGEFILSDKLLPLYIFLTKIETV